MSIKDIAQSIIKSINDGDTLTTISLGAQNFHSDSVKIASVLLKKKLGGIIIETSSTNNQKINWCIIGIGLNKPYSGWNIIEIHWCEKHLDTLLINSQLEHRV